MPRRVRPICFLYTGIKTPVITCLGGANMRITTRGRLIVRPSEEPCWHYFSHLGASWPLFSLLAAFLVALGWFVVHLGADFARPERVFRAFGTSFGTPRAMFFQVCSCTHTCNANTAREAFCIGKTNTKRMSATLLVSHKAKKNRSNAYLKSTPGQSSLRI